MALDGLEHQLHQAIPRQGNRVNFIRYADDFIITATNKELLTEKILPLVKTFLTPRGLTLSAEKTHITTIDQGFDFLGCNLRKYSNKLLIIPKRSKVCAFARQIRALIRKGVALRTEDLLKQLNRKLRGWFHYYRAFVSKRVFAYIDYIVYKALWRWMHRRHPTRGKYWLYRHYFATQRTPNKTYRQIFYARYARADGTTQQITLFKLSDLSIRRHVRIRMQATPYDPAY
jgi:RNA-directed DNA polymerase